MMNNYIVKILKNTGRKQASNSVRIYLPKDLREKLNTKIIFNYKELSIKPTSVYEKRGNTISKTSFSITSKVPEFILDDLVGEYTVEEDENEIYYLTKI